MTAEEFKILFEEDDTFAAGVKVWLRWTNSGRQFSGVGTITRLNAKTLRATLDHEVGLPSEPFGYYPAGHEIIVPRIDDAKKWTANNCARRAVGSEPQA